MITEQELRRHMQENGRDLDEIEAALDARADYLMQLESDRRAEETTAQDKETPR